ncbi:MAG: FKBP-type peptidyl-prolyl cis-trans isomerase [Chloroherpetonaceae bacterium]|nr:FKBP-type peptidyl-prolyl cis-trans isomerase [Chthonomonadaceae bacterium]MDW8206568.1 FKBP-type peptidyl-prolyl cis-trans isomerase [Chloroherpetonaceae bacterium]
MAWKHSATFVTVVLALNGVCGCTGGADNRSVQGEQLEARTSDTGTLSPGKSPVETSPSSDGQKSDDQEKKRSVQGTAGNPRVRTPTGLQYEDIVIGKGDMPRKGQTVTVHYVGTFADGTKFDSSLDRGKPFRFRIGEGQVIPGWDEGVATMRVGGKRRLIVPPDLGYGPNDYGPIPGNSTLYFEVELLGVE